MPYLSKGLMGKCKALMTLTLTLNGRDGGMLQTKMTGSPDYLVS